MSNFFKTVRNSIKYWYVSLLVGILFLIVEIYTFVTPLESYVALSVLFSVSFLASGVAEIIFSISNKNEIEGWGWNLAFGILTLITGVLLLMNPAISITTLPFYIGFLLMFRSIMGISYAIELKNYGVLN